MRWIPAAILFAVFCASVWASCPVPKEYNVQSVEYPLEKIASSVKVRLEFPKLSDRSCDEEAVSFGTLYTWKLDAASPVKLKVTDRNSALVKEVVITGDLKIKVTPTWAAMYFWDSVWSPKLLDHTLSRIELWSTSSLFPTPAANILDAGVDRRLVVTIKLY